MNYLKTYTVATEQPDAFHVYWTNSDRRPGGLLKVQIRPDMEDRLIAAELSAIQFLLEDKMVVGNMVVCGQGIKLAVSQGAIRKLHGKRSNKSHLAPYASFLITRFSGCRIEVCKDEAWFAELSIASAELLQIDGPRRESMTIAGLGKVDVSNHVLKRFAERELTNVDPSRQMNEAWKKLQRIVSDRAVLEVSRRNQTAPMRFAKPGFTEGRYFMNREHDIVLVVTDRPGDRKLVTLYRATRDFVALPQIA